MKRPGRKGGVSRGDGEGTATQVGGNQRTLVSWEPSKDCTEEEEVSDVSDAAV